MQTYLNVPLVTCKSHGQNSSLIAFLEVLVLKAGYVKVKDVLVVIGLN